jgi:5-methylcytosine-specific restriction endonuclease McrA
MTCTKTPADRRRDSETYNAEYRRNRKTTLDRARYRCEIQTDVCTGKATTCDHILPVSQGGTHALSNLRAACSPQDRRRRRRIPQASQHH